jgi:transcriptional regulator with XRE-family HTH domain
MKGINNIGKNIRMLRVSLGISQQKLGESVGLSQKFISRVEKGSSLPCEYLRPIADKLGLDNPFDLVEDKFVVKSVLGGTVIKY